MEEDEDDQDTSIKGRLLMLVNKIKGQAHKAEEPTQKEQTAPCEEVTVFIALLNNISNAALQYLGLDEKLVV